MLAASKTPFFLKFFEKMILLSILKVLGGFWVDFQEQFLLHFNIYFWFVLSSL